MNFRRGEVCEVRPDPSIGKEIQKQRPCVIVSSNIFNDNSGLCVVCPVTEGINLPADSIHISLPKGEGGATKDCIILCDQVESVDQDRIIEKRGNLSKDTMQKIDKGLRQILLLH